MVDSTVQKQPRMHRERVRGGFRLGPYEILASHVRESALDQSIVEVEGAPHPAYRYDLELALNVPDKQRVWSTRCVGKREANIDTDFGVIAGIQNDTIVIECKIDGSASHWSLVAGGRLDHNIGGELQRAGASIDDAPLEVELILWAQRLKYFRRDLPYPVVQVRRGKQVIAAMVIARTEWAWVQPRASEEEREVAMATLAAVRLLPLGFDD